MSSNLPPGVSDSSIPGNRPEDALDEQILGDIWSVLADHGIFEPEDYEQSDKLNSGLLDLVLKYRDMGMREGLDDARMTLEMAPTP